MGRAIAAALICAGLAAAGGAQAKAPQTGIDLCGASGCRHLAWLEAEQVLIGWQQNLARPAPFAPFYAVHIPWSATEEQIVYWVPSAGVRRGDLRAPVWTRVNASARAILSEAANGIEPFQIEPTRVTVGGREVRAPATYVRLLQRRTWLETWPATPWLAVKFETAVPSPWSDDAAEILLARHGRLLAVDGWVVRIPKAVAQRARRGLPLR
jgi:hypothetical protein